jgi:hypothetical protein
VQNKPRNITYLLNFSKKPLKNRSFSGLLLSSVSLSFLLIYNPVFAATALSATPSAATPIIIDDKDARFASTPSTWFSPDYFHNDAYNATAKLAIVSSIPKASWTFSNLREGHYAVRASEVVYHNNGNVIYKIYDGATQVGSVHLNQSITPKQPIVINSGNVPVSFVALATVPVTSGTLRIELVADDNPGYFLYADAVSALATPDAVTPYIPDPTIINIPNTGPSFTTNDQSWGNAFWNNDKATKVATVKPGLFAQWEATGVPNGTYLVQADWAANANLGKAVYSISSGSGTPAVVHTNQGLAPLKPVIVITDRFQTLTTIVVENGIVKIKLTADTVSAGKYLAADKIRLVGKAPAPIIVTVPAVTPPVVTPPVVTPPVVTPPVVVVPPVVTPPVVTPPVVTPPVVTPPVVTPPVVVVPPVTGLLTVTSCNTRNDNLHIMFSATMIKDACLKAAQNTPEWQNFVTSLKNNLTTVLNEGDYQGSELEWIGHYALAYRILKDSNPVLATQFADKAIALMKSGLHDLQKGGWESRQFLAVGDGVTKTYTLPADVIPSTVKAWISPVRTINVTHTGAQDAVEYYDVFLKVTNATSRVFTKGVDWRQNGDYTNNIIDWSVPGSQAPALGSSYAVTLTSALYSTVRATITMTGNKLTMATPPTAGQAVFVQYIYGTHSADGSTLAFQQTSEGTGGFNSIMLDANFTARYLGKFISIGYDWLNDYPGLTPALKAESAYELKKWFNYLITSGYNGNYIGSNYGADSYSSNVLSAVALNGRDPDATAMVASIKSFRTNHVLTEFLPPAPGGATLFGGHYPDGENYGPQAIMDILLGAMAGEQAGFWNMAPERSWATSLIHSLISEQPTRTTIYDDGDWYAYPTPFPAKDMFYVLENATDQQQKEGQYANYIIRNYAGNRSGMLQLIFDNMDATKDWTTSTDFQLQNLAVGSGLLTARADWSYNSTWLAYIVGNYEPGADHQANAPSHLRIQRGADDILPYAVAYFGGAPRHTKSMFSNLVAVDSNNDGEQTYPWTMGVWYGIPGVATLAYEVDPANRYVYMGSNITAAYSQAGLAGNGGPVSNLTRQVVYLRPDTIIVHDRAATKRSTSPKRLQWHFLRAPVIAGNSWIESIGSSKLFGQTYSDDPSKLIGTVVETVTNNGKTVFRAGTQLLTPATSVNFTSVLQSAPSSTMTMASTNQVVTVQNTMAGAQWGNQLVLFAISATNIAAGQPISYHATDNGQPVMHLLVDLTPGTHYTVRVDRGQISTSSVVVSTNGTVNFTTVGAGVITLQ